MKSSIPAPGAFAMRWQRRGGMPYSHAPTLANQRREIMRVEILCESDEILTGKTVNTD